jgi:cleavage and polyadenylation specificity factor subunit 1
MKRKVIHLSLCDSIPAYGPIADMAFSLARNGVSCAFLSLAFLLNHFQDRPVPELVVATGSGHMGGFTLFQVRILSWIPNQI